MPEQVTAKTDIKPAGFGNLRTRTVTIPNTNILLACVVTVCFNPILGPIAAYYSLTAARSYRDGHPKEGARRALISVAISLIGIICTVAIVMALIIWSAINDHQQGKHSHSESSMPLIGSWWELRLVPVTNILIGWCGWNVQLIGKLRWI